MRFTALLAFAATLTGAWPAEGAARLTEHCNTNFGTGEVAISAPGAARAELLAIAAEPARNLAIHERLWQPLSGRLLDYISFEDQVLLSYDPLQDTEQIAADIRGDPVLAALGVTHADPNTTQICFATMPPPVRVTVTEYHNRILDHYFLSSSAQENAVIDAGGAGAGWARTGEVLHAIQPGYCYGSRPVFRFYTFGANTHFFTADASECGFLRRNDPGWVFEAEAFGATLPEGGLCSAGTTPVWRLYNNRWMFNDSNHRFVVSAALRDQMAARGWVSEGVALCLQDWGPS